MNGSAAYSPINYASFYVTMTAVREIARRAMNGSAAYVSSTTNTFTFSSILFAISLKCFASSAI